MSDRVESRNLLPERAPRRRLATLLAALLPFAVAALVFWLVIVPSSRRETLARWDEQLTGRVAAMASSVEEWLRVWKADARVIAGYPSLRAALQGGDERTAYVIHVREIFADFERENDGSRVARFDRDGTLVPGAWSGTPPGRIFDEAVSATIRTGLQDTRFVVMPDGSPSMLITAPVRSGEPGAAPLGAVVLVVDAQRWLYPFLSIEPAVIGSAESLLVQREKDSVVFISPLRFRPDKPGTYRLPVSKGRLIAASALGEPSGFGSFVDYRGEPVFGVATKIADSQLGLVVKVDASDVLRYVWKSAMLDSLYVVIPAFTIAFLTLAFVWWQRRAVLRERTRHLEKIALLLEQANDAILAVSADGRILSANRRAVEMYGRSEQELLALDVAELRPESIRRSAAADMERVRREGEATFRTIHTRRDGTPFPVEINSRIHTLEGVTGLVSVVRDVSEQAAGEARIAYLTRTLRTFSRIGELTIRSTSREELLRDSCTAIVREAGVPLVWIGRGDPDGSIAVVASAGDAIEYLEGIKVRWDDSPEGQGPTGKALREQVAVHVDDFGRDGRTLPWHERASGFGLRASFAVPVSPGGERDAVLTIYSAEEGFFDDEVRAIFRELSADLAFALRTISDRDEKERAGMLLRTIVEDSPVPIYVIDTERRVVSWNRACELVFGWSAQEIIGHPLPIVPPDREEEHRALFAGLLRGEPIDRKAVTRRRRDGTLLELELSVATLRDAQGEITGVVAVALDITDARRAERRAKALFDAGVIGTLEGDIHGRVFAANDEFLRIIGYSRADLDAGRVRWDLLTPSEWLPLDAERIAEARERGTCVPYEKEFVRSDGSRIAVVVGFQLLEPERENSVAIILDVSALKYAEGELRRLNADLESRVAERTRALEIANRELEAFSYSVSHDLRAPLRAIDGFSRILEEEHLHELDGEARRLLGIVRQSTRGMGQLIDDLLAFSRVGRHQLRMAPVAMKALANEVWLEFQEAQRAGVEFRLGELPDAAGDGALLRQVWQNLLSNALKYSAPKPSRSIEVGHTIEGGRAVYFVRDNGVGFDMQHVDRLFGVFERLHPARDFEGTGVGLALARRIVERHGGSMRAEGEVGAGATFYFTLESRGDASGT